VRAFTAGLAVACLVAPHGGSAAEPPAIVTLLESQPALLRGTARYALAEGVRLQPGDIVEVGDKGVAQVEFADGLILSLGPGSRFYAAALVSRAAKGGGISDFYLMRGWAKFASGKAAAPFRLSTPEFGLGTADAIAVVQVGEAEGALFVESGDVRIAEGFVKAAPNSPIRLRGGEFFARKSEQKGSVQPRASHAFVGAMPKIYMDNLPARAGKWKDREVPPLLAGELTYSDVELWLKAPPEIRKVLMRPFIPRANDHAFRTALIANLKFHPEWDPILFPEKYKPKPPPEPPQPPLEPPVDQPAAATKSGPVR
jgi:hypothetical protein